MLNGAASRPISSTCIHRAPWAGASAGASGSTSRIFERPDSMSRDATTIWSSNVAYKRVSVNNAGLRALAHAPTSADGVRATGRMMPRAFNTANRRPSCSTYSHSS